MQDRDATEDTPAGADERRRGFLAACGRFAAVTPPAVTMLLSTSLTSAAIAKSGGRTPTGRNSDGLGGSGHPGGPAATR
jgi:hypothetical protein